MWGMIWSVYREALKPEIFEAFKLDELREGFRRPADCDPVWCIGANVWSTGKWQDLDKVRDQSSGGASKGVEYTENYVHFYRRILAQLR